MGNCSSLWGLIMKFKVKKIDIESDSSKVIINREDAKELGIHVSDRIKIEDDGKSFTGVVETTIELVDPGELGVTNRLNDLGEYVDLSIASKPESVNYIRKKLDGNDLESEEIDRIVRDIYKDKLNDIELGAYVSSIYVNDLCREEIINLTKSMVDVGDVLEWDENFIADKHSIGGVPGNRVTPVVVPIVAAAGLKIPKTSSRAITSPSGTADSLEVFCDVEFSVQEIKRIVNKTNGCMVWGGSVDLSPVDDKIIRAEHPLTLDPYGQVIASVLSKKKSTGSNHIVIDIPYGEGSKVAKFSKAKQMAKDFKLVGSDLGMNIECTITRGDQPIGKGIGPVPEAKDILNVLEGKGPKDLRLKSLRLSEVILDLADSNQSAEKILDNGNALEKFRQIIKAQNGDPNIRIEDLEDGKHIEEIRSTESGVVTHIDNKLISEIASRAGAPKDKRSGIYLHQKVGDRVSKDEVLYSIHAEKKDKLKKSIEFSKKVKETRVRDKDESLISRV